jgi:hypothetical protein
MSRRGVVRKRMTAQGRSRLGVPPSKVGVRSFEGRPRWPSAKEDKSPAQPRPNRGSAGAD